MYYVSFPIQRDDFKFVLLQDPTVNFTELITKNNEYLLE